MPENETLGFDAPLNHPWLVAVWPGMGQVAVSAGYYLMSQLEMHQLAEFSARELFDVNHIEVKGGLIGMGRQPRNRLFVWEDPRRNHDIVVFIGEAQPPAGKVVFCQKLIDFASEIEVERVFTFAAMATDMHPKSESRVFGAATDPESLEELKRLELEIMEDGQIGGLNGVLLGLAGEEGLPGTCLLGEMPGMFTQLPFPKASLAVLEAFTAMARIDLDMTELTVQARESEKQLEGLIGQIEHLLEQRQESEETPWKTEGGEVSSPAPAGGLGPGEERRIEELFAQAADDRKKAFELKAELDRLEVFHRYEDRFLDLFQKPE